ncbi:MAG: DsbC family protein [Persephonella sp.]|nr:MAG: DsbC family protein [Persephonella sp.]
MKLKKILTTAVSLSLAISLVSSCNEESKKGKAEAEPTPKSVNAGECLPASMVSKDKVKQALSMFGNLEVVKIDKSPINGLYKVIIKAGGRYAVVYLDCKLQYAIIGSMIDIQSKRDLTRETMVKYQLEAQKEKLELLKKKLGEKKFEELKKVLGSNIAQLMVVDLKNIPKEGTIIYGNPDAKYTVYVISDPECPFCAKLHESIKEIVKKDKDVKFEIILFPLPFHPYAKGIAENIASQSSMEKRREILDKSFQAVSKRDSSTLSELSKGNEKGEKIISEHKAFAKSVNLRGTPMIIFPEGIAIGGAIPTDLLYKMIEVLKK